MFWHVIRLSHGKNSPKLDPSYSEEIVHIDSTSEAGEAMHYSFAIACFGHTSTWKRWDCFVVYNFD